MALRYIEIVLPASDTPFDPSWLADVEIVDLWQGRLDDKRMTVSAVLEAEHTDSFLDVFERRFGLAEGFRAIVQNVSATLPRPPDPEKEKEKEKEEEAAAAAGAPSVAAPVEAEAEPPKAKKASKSVSREELLDALTPGTKITTVYVVMILLSGVVAAVGLVRGNVAVVIGAMVIAPLLTPNMALALATTLGDLDMAKGALKTLVVGGAVALVFALLVGMVWRVDPSAPEIMARSNPRWDDFVVALASGAAGALAFTSGASASLVGVMVAVALLPPLVVVGLLVGGGNVALGMQAAALFAINVICVNLAAVVTFFWRGVRPRAWWEKDKARRYTRIAMGLWAGLLIALATLLALVQP